MSEDDLRQLVRIAVREQRYACLNNIAPLGRSDFESKVQNAPSPEPDRVLELWRKELENQ